MVGGRAAGVNRERNLMPAGNSRRYVVPAVSMALAAVFIYSGVEKFRDPPLQFADNIAGFAILPQMFINLLALGLPPFEIASSLLILAPATRRVGALAVAVVSVMFLAALSSALLRGLTLDCGCFGVGAPSRPRMWLEGALDVVLFASALFVYLRSSSRLVFASR